MPFYSPTKILANRALLAGAFSRLPMALALLAILAAAQPALAQQEPLFTQYMFNRLAQSPAYAGSQENWAFTGMYRNQWTGFSGAPRTFSLAAHNAFGLDKQHGVGILALNDQLGDTRRTSVGANYAFRIHMKNKSVLALGVQAAALSYSYSASDAVVAQENDPMLQNSAQTTVLPDFGAGINYNTNRWFVSFSALHLIPLDVKFSNGASAGKLASNFFLTAGADFPTNPGNSLVFSPSFQLRATPGAAIQADVNLITTWFELFWTGLAYRNNDAVAFLVGVLPAPKFRIGYSYDYGISSWRTSNFGTHEVMISYVFSNNRKRNPTITPRYY